MTMPDFTLTPDEAMAAHVGSDRPVNQNWLAPTADIPKTKTKVHPPCTGPCPGCGREVLTGQTRNGTVLMLDTQTLLYCVVWDSGAALPRLEPSRGYPLHTCPAFPTTKESGDA
jgi:hypothetical protein